MMLLFQRINHIEAVFDKLFALRVEIGVVQFDVQIGCHIFQIDQCAFDTLHIISHLRHKWFDSAQGCQSLAQQFVGTNRFAIEARQSSGYGRFHLFGVIHGLQFVFQQFLFVVGQIGSCKLVVLELRIIAVGTPRIGRLLHGGKLSAYLFVSPIMLRISLGFGVRGGYGIKRLQLKCRFAEQQIFVLRMNVNQAIGHGAQLLQIDRHVVDKGARFAIVEYFAPQDALVVVVDIQLRKQGFERQIGHVEHGFDDAFVFAGLNGFGVGTLSQNQRQRTDDDRFACAGFAGNDRQSRFKIDVEMLYQRIILYFQTVQHARCSIL